MSIRELASERRPTLTSLPAGIAALALISGLILCATILMVVTSGARIAWPASWLRMLCLLLVVAVLAPQAADFSPRRLLFALGMLLGLAPSVILTAKDHQIDHWDDFMTWLPNAKYIWTFGTFPLPEVPAVASVWPGYPPGSSLILASIWSVTGRAVEEAGPFLNIASLGILAGLIAGVFPDHSRTAFGQMLFGVSLGLCATILNPALDWHWVLSSLPDTITLVALAAAFVLAIDVIVHDETPDLRRQLALALILALVINLKQTGIVLVVLLMASALVVRVAFNRGRARQFKEGLLSVFLVCLPSFLVWTCWRVYTASAIPSGSFSFRPFHGWNFLAIPDLLASIVASSAEHWPYFIPFCIVTSRGCYVLCRRWFRLDAMPPSAADHYAAMFSVLALGYTAFLLITYLGAFSEGEARGAAEWFRYQAHIGGAGLIATVVLVASWIPSALQRLAGLIALGLVLASATIILPAPGLYPGRAIYSHDEVQQLRAIGSSVGALLAQEHHTRVELISGDGFLATLIVRYELWSASLQRIRQIDWTLPTSDDDLVQRAVAAHSSSSPALVLKAYDGIHCGLFIAQSGVTLGSSSESPLCRKLRQRIELPKPIESPPNL